MKSFFLFLMPVLLGSCNLLVPIEDDPIRHLLEAEVTERTPTRGSPSIAVATPSLPPYLERVELVTRTGDGRLEVHEKNLWSEPLDAAMARVIADNLRRHHRFNKRSALHKLHYTRLLRAGRDSDRAI